MKFNSLANNFSAGEWSEKLVARSDAQEFKNACLKMQNFIPKISGGAYKRNGTRKINFSPSGQTALDSYRATYAGALPLAKQPARLIPWNLSDGTRKVVIVGNAPPAGGPSPGILIYDVDTGAVDTLLGTYSTTFTAEPGDIHFAQVGDTLILTLNDTGFGSIQPAVIFRQGGSFLISEWINFAPVIFLREHEVFPFRPIVALGSGGPNLTTSGTAGSITVTSSSAFFNASHVGAVFKFNSGGNTGVARVTAFTSSTSVTMVVSSTLPLTGTYGTAAGTSWEESAWSNFRGWPRSITAYQGRLVFGGNRTNPNYIWGSRIGNFFYFMERPFENSPGFSSYLQDNSRAFTLEPVDAFASRIVALSSKETLQIITDRSEIVGSATQGAFGPLDFKFEQAGNFGGAPVQPARAGNSAIYTANVGNKVKELIFDDSAREFRVNDLAFTSDHFRKPNFFLEEINETSPSNFNDVSSVWTHDRFTCRILNTDKQYKQNAWWRFETDGIVYSSCYIPKTTTGSAKQMILAARGASALCLEEMDYEDFTDYPDLSSTRQYFLDSAVTTAGSYSAPNFTITGLSHLNGKTVTVLQFTNQRIVATATVSAGSITFANTNVVSPSGSTVFVIGLPFTAVVTTYPIEIGNQVPETSQGRIKKVDEMVIKLYRTIRLKYGKTEADAVNTVDLDLTNPLNSPPALFTGSYVAYLDQGYDRQFSVTMVSDEPYPCNILAIIPRGVTYD